MKKIAALAATMLSMLLLFTTPANAAYGDLLAADSGSCTTSNGSAAPELLNMRVYQDTTGVLKTVANFEDSKKRTWTWKLYHNGDVSAKLTIDQNTTGGYGNSGVHQVIRDVVDFAGQDNLRYEFTNASGTVVCNTRVGEHFLN